MKWIPIFTMCQTTQRKIYEQMRSQMGEEQMNDQSAARTVRLILPVSVTGSRLRLCFKNADLQTGEIQRIVIAKCTESGQIAEGTAQTVTFQGESYLTVEGQGRKTSDSLRINVKAGEYLAVSAYSESMNLSVNSIEAMMIQSEPGDLCDVTFQNVDPTPEFMRQRGLYMSPQFPMLSMIEIESEEAEPTVIGCLGDSITQQGYWFYPLLKRICREIPEKAVLLNAGIAGNRLCKDSPENYGTLFGSAGVKRIEEDIFEIPYINTIIFALGINDLMSGESEYDSKPSPSAEEFGRACRQVAERAGKANIHTVAYTLYPAFIDSDTEIGKKREALFHAYNDEIRRAGFDKVIELDPILKDPDGCQRYKEGMSQPDGLHLSDKGGAVLVETLCLEDLEH